MNDRDRLIGLIQDAVNGCARHWAEIIADHLLANGVIVPPCKVGQTVYYLFQFSDTRILPFVRKAKVRKIYCANSKMQFLVDCELKDTKEKGIIRAWYFDAFGKTVFLTKEEAEKALNERKDNNG